MMLSKTQSNIFAAAFGAGSAISLEAVQGIFVSEIVAIVIFGLVIATRSDLGMASNIRLRLFIMGYVILLVGLIYSDVSNATALADLSKGWATIFASSLSLLSIYALIRIDKKNAAIIVAFVAMSILTKSIMNLELANFESSNFFKAYLGRPAFLLVGLSSLFFFKRSKRTVAVFLAMFGLLFIGLEARSLGLILSLVAVVTYFSASFRKVETSAVLGLSAAVFTLSMIGYYFYVDYALSSPSSSNSYIQVSKLVNPYNPFELLAQARSEIVVSIEAISDRPMTGYGSWALDKTGKYNLMIRDIKDVTLNKDLEMRPWIPAHSVILTSWLWGGILGLIGISVIFYNHVKLSVSCLVVSSAFTPLVLILILDSIWNFAFSPFGHLRTSIPLALACSAYFGQQGFRGFRVASKGDSLSTAARRRYSAKKRKYERHCSNAP